VERADNSGGFIGGSGAARQRNSGTKRRPARKKKKLLRPFREEVVRTRTRRIGRRKVSTTRGACIERTGITIITKKKLDC